MIETSDISRSVYYSHCISGLMNSEHQIITMSQPAIKAFGFGSHEEVVGITSHDLPDEFLKCAAHYIQQDKQVLASQETLDILDIMSLEGEINFLYTKKQYVNDKTGFEGVAYFSHQLCNKLLQNLLYVLLAKNSRIYGKNILSDMATFQLADDCLNGIQLTKRQYQILYFLVLGKTSKEIAKIYHLSPRTVESHLSILKNRFRCSNKTELIDLSIQAGVPFCLPKQFIPNVSVVVSSVLD